MNEQAALKREIMSYATICVNQEALLNKPGAEWQISHDLTYMWHLEILNLQSKPKAWWLGAGDQGDQEVTGQRVQTDTSPRTVRDIMKQPMMQLYMLEHCSSRCSVCTWQTCGKGKWKWPHGSVQPALVILFTLNSNHFKDVKHSEVSFLIWFFFQSLHYFIDSLYFEFLFLWKNIFWDFILLFFLLEKLRNGIWNI